MKTIILATIATAGLALSLSPALAHGRVIRDQTIYQPAQATEQPASSTGTFDHTLGVSSHGIEGREFHAVQQGTHWIQEGDEY